MFKRTLLQISAAVAVGAAALGAQAATVNGAGASFPAPIYQRWAAEYNKATGHKVNYTSIGSGGGQKQIFAKTVDFAGSDDPLPGDVLTKENVLQFPAIIGGTVPVVNIDGVKPGELKLTGAAIADIYLGKIKSWDHETIKSLNPGINLPKADIIVVHRADGSGTTFSWTNYLSKTSESWKAQVGEGKAVKWPTGQGGKGNEGVAAYVRQLKNSIGYVEYAYAKQNNLSWTQLQNRDGKFVQPTQENFAAAAGNADWDSVPGMGVVLTHEPGESSWPITVASFILIHKVQDKPETAKEVLNFFDWAFKNGAGSAAELDYVPLPDNVTDKIRGQWRADIKGADGSAVWQ